MAAVTVTSTQVNNGPILTTSGLNVKRVQFKAGPDIAVTVCTSVCLQMVAVPDGARILDIITKATGIGAQLGNFQIGDGSLTARFQTATSITASTVVSRLNVPGGAGFLVSLTASHVPSTFDTIDMTFVALTATRTMSIEMSVYYVMEPR